MGLSVVTYGDGVGLSGVTYGDGVGLSGVTKMTGWVCQV